MKYEPDIVRILREEEKHGKLSSNNSVNKLELEICESIDDYTQDDSSLYLKNENYEIDNLNKTVSESSYKVFSDLMEIINFTEKVSASLHGDFTQEEIIRVVINKFKKSDKYTGSILLLSDDGKKLRVAGTSSYTNKFKRAEKISGYNIKNYRISLEKSQIYSKVIHEGKTVHFKIMDLLEEIFSKKLASFIGKTIKIDKNMHVATPLKLDGRIIGAFAMSTTILHDFFIPSVKNLALHISYAFERAKYILEQKNAQAMLSQSEKLYRTMIERAPLGIFTVDTRGVVTSCNEAFIKMAGYSRDDLVGKNIAHFPTIRKRDKPKYMKMFKSIINGDVPKPFEFYWTHKGGTQRAGELYISLIRINNKITGIQAIIRDITETKEVKGQLKESEEKYKDLVTLANDGIAIIQSNKVDFINQRAADMLGYTVDELLEAEADFVKYIAPEVRDQLIQRYRMRIEGKNPPNVYESQLLKKNGEIIPVEINASLINYHGEPADMAIIRDITERKQMEKELKEAKNHFQEMFNIMVDPVVIVDSKGKFLELTNKVEEITGFKKEELLGKNFLKTKIVTAKSKRILLKSLIKRMTGLKLAPYEIEIITKDGKKLPFEINAATIEYKGKPADMIAFRDISERKKSEDAVRESEEKFRNIFEKANDGIVYLDKTGRILDINKKATELFAGSKKEILGKNFTKIGIFHPKEIPKLMTNFTRILVGKERTLDVTIKNKKHQIIHLECSGSYFKKDKQFTGLLVVVRDITERKKAEKELEDAHNKLRTLNLELEQKVRERTTEVKKLLKQKDEFINQLGHDLKNPLNPIVNLLPLIKTQAYDSKSEEQMKVVMRNVDFMKNLVVKTIELARLNSPNTEFILDDTNLLNEVNNIVEKNKLILEENNIEIINNLNEKIIVKADKLRLVELFDNLISNAIKYSPNGSSITVDAQDNKDFVTVSVKDTGIGLDEQQIDHIFDEFFKVDKSRHDIDSSGLGLTISKRIVEKHGGRIWAETAGPGKGTTIFFTLPSSSKKL
ncbi:MAG: PAS domain S-box protein [Candidatus Hodarchaeota archaeon]